MGCGPLLDRLRADPAFQALLAAGRASGALTLDQVNAFLPSVVEQDVLGDLVDWLDADGIALIDPPEPDAVEPPSADGSAGVFPALPDGPDDDSPPVYRRDAAFDQLLESLGVSFTDAAASYESDGRVFDAELIVPGEHALAAWLALRNRVPQTGLWPVLKEDVRGLRYWDEMPGPEPLDPRGRRREWFERWRLDRSLTMFQPAPDEIRADAAANVTEAANVPPTPWTFRRNRGRPAPPPPDGPDDDRDPPEPDLAELYSARGPFRAHLSGGGCPGWPPHPLVRLRLYPTAVPWEVFAYAPCGGWNDCPYPDEQLAMLRHWHTRYGAEVVSDRGTWYELFVPRPPRTRHAAHRLVQEMAHFGEETFYSHGPTAHPDPVEAVRGSHYWYFWWD